MKEKIQNLLLYSPAAVAKSLPASCVVTLVIPYLYRSFISPVSRMPLAMGAQAVIPYQFVIKSIY